MMARIAIAISIGLTATAIGMLVWKLILAPGADELSWEAFLRTTVLGAIAIGASLFALTKAIEMASWKDDAECKHCSHIDTHWECHWCGYEWTPEDDLEEERR